MTESESSEESVVEPEGWLAADVIAPPISQPAGGQGPEYVPGPKNTLGVIGLVLAIVSLVIFSFLGPVAVVVSLIAMRRKPKDMALTGFIIGTFVTCMLFWAVLFGIFILAGSNSLQTTTSNLFMTSQTRMTVQTEAWSVATAWRTQEKLPTQAEGDKLIGAATDSWNNPIYYEMVDEGFRMRSYGPDGKADTIDDIIAGPYYSADEVSQF